MSARAIILFILFLLSSTVLFVFLTNQNNNSQFDEITEKISNIGTMGNEDENPDPKLEVTNVIDANNNFTIDIYKEYSGQKGNIFLSPFSVSSAMVMVYEGAASKTAQEIQEVFYFPQGDNLRRTEYKNLYGELNSDNENYEFNVANALWVEKTYKLKPEYVKNVEEFYYGKATQLDYKNKSDDAIKTINKWVSDKTNNKIPTIVSSNNVNSLTRVVLTNAIYFKGLWNNGFVKDLTQKDNFKTLDGNDLPVDMMSTGYDPINLNYYDDGDVEVLEIPYKGRDYSMVIFLPEFKKFTQFEEDFNIFKYQNYLDSLTNREVKVFIPKYKLENSYALIEPLNELGINDAFGGNANFENMTASNDIFISDIVHKTFIDVDEEGTEAAAATGVVAVEMSALPKKAEKPIVFRADHPFMFVIKNNNNGNIMFIGRYIIPE